MRHIISLKEQTGEDILTLLDLAKILKQRHRVGNSLELLKQKTLVMMFEKTSTRTRISFEAAMTQLGGHAIFLDKRTTQFSLADPRDEIRAVMRLGDILMYRAVKAESVLTASYMSVVPVIDACSEKYHPAQALSDLLTMSEHSGGIEHVRHIAWLGIENNVSNTLVLACAKLGIRSTIIAPEIDADSVDIELRAQADATGLVTRTLDLTALHDAGYIHTDTWMNMEFFDGEKVKPEFQEQYEARKARFFPYQINAELVSRYCPQAKIMHCMPCHVGNEISRDAIDHPNSVIFDQAENRLHMQKAMLVWLLEKEAIVV